jgi:hypothetical protein
MKAIYKYRLDITDEQFVSLPKGATILKYGEQRGDLYFWALVDLSNPSELVKFYIKGTGLLMDDAFLLNKKYQDTVTALGVWHIFRDEKAN